MTIYSKLNISLLGLNTYQVVNKDSRQDYLFNLYKTRYRYGDFTQTRGFHRRTFILRVNLHIKNHTNNCLNNVMNDQCEVLTIQNLHKRNTKESCT